MIEKVLPNPHKVVPTYKRINDPARKFFKLYQPLVVLPTRRQFKTATEALEYAYRVHNRWCRLYDAAIVAMMNPSPVGAEEGQVVEAVE